jgi:hypothetical protein
MTRPYLVTLIASAIWRSEDLLKRIDVLLYAPSSRITEKRENKYCEVHPAGSGACGHRLPRGTPAEAVALASYIK